MSQTRQYIESLVQDTQVHRDVYVDQSVFDLEMPSLPEYLGLRWPC